MLRKLRGLLSGILLVLCVSFIVVGIWHSWSQILPYLQRVNPMYLLLSQGCILVALLLGATTWYFVQDGYQIGLTFPKSIATHFAANLTRYVPGYVWQYMSKAYLIGVNTQNKVKISSALIAEFNLLIGSGIGILSILAVFYPDLPFVRSYPNLIWKLSGILAIAIIYGWFFYSTFRLNTLHNTNIASNCIKIFWGLICALVGWLFFGLSTWLTVLAFTPTLSFVQFFQILFALTGSTLVSILIIFVPGGVGIRESVLALLLGPIVPFPVGIAIGLILRIGVMLGETLLFFLVFKQFLPLFSLNTDK